MTRETNLPSNDYSLIAVAPWISANCTKSYLAAASSSGARAFLTYLALDPQTRPPPVPNDPAWSLNDGGQWRSTNKYPVYALQPSDGAQIMLQLSLYSGNMTDAPNGHLLTEQFDSRNYIRLYCDVNTGSSSELPSLWVFILIVIAMFVAIISLTSLSMHILQRSRRNQLRRLIESGEVDLEALGIKRLQVPQSVLDKMPLFIYVANDEGVKERTELASSTPFTLANTASATPSDPSPRHSPTVSQPTRFEVCRNPSNESLPYRKLPYVQPTCPICLEDFLSHETIVRELPCRHIYHSECIDPLLREYSSLCPVCKGKVLPLGYCPVPVTNSMVRRERLIRRMRERVPGDGGVSGNTAETSGIPSALGHRIADFHRLFGWSRNNGVNGRAAMGVPIMMQSRSVAQITTPNDATIPNGVIEASYTGPLPHSPYNIVVPPFLADADEEEHEPSLPRCKLRFH